MNALPVWDLLWILRFSRREKHFPHKAQRWGFSLVWVRMWISILYLKKKIYCYISVHKTREPHTKFLCLIDDVFCFQTTIPEILFMETCAEKLLLKIFKRSQTTWHHYISLWAITAFENWKRNNDDKFFSILLSLFSKSKMVCLKCSNQRHIP